MALEATNLAKDKFFLFGLARANFEIFAAKRRTQRAEPRVRARKVDAFYFLLMAKFVEATEKISSKTRRKN